MEEEEAGDALAEREETAVDDLVVGATIVFVLPLEEEDVFPFRVGDIVQADKNELVTVQYRGFDPSAKIHGKKCNPYNARYRLVWDDESADGKGERQTDRKDCGWSPVTVKVDSSWVWGVVQLATHLSAVKGTLSLAVQEQLRAL